MTGRLLVLVPALALTAVAQPPLPRPAPEFVIKLTDGKQILLSQYRGKVVALEFLLTTCPHCKTCSTLMNKLYEEYGPRGFQPLGVAFNEMAGLFIPDYIKELKLVFPVGTSERQPVLDFLMHSAFLRMLVPQLVFVDRKGAIRAQYAGDHEFFKDEEKNMRAQVEALLKESEAVRKSASVSKAKKAPSAASAKGLQ